MKLLNFSPMNFLPKLDPKSLNKVYRHNDCFGQFQSLFNFLYSFIQVCTLSLSLALHYIEYKKGKKTPNCFFWFFCEFWNNSREFFISFEFICSFSGSICSKLNIILRNTKNTPKNIILVVTNKHISMLKFLFVMNRTPSSSSLILNLSYVILFITY